MPHQQFYFVTFMPCSRRIDSYIGPVVLVRMRLVWYRVSGVRIEVYAWVLGLESGWNQSFKKDNPKMPISKNTDPSPTPVPRFQWDYCSKAHGSLCHRLIKTSILSRENFKLLFTIFAVVILHNVINDVIVGDVCGCWWLAKTTETVLGFAYFSTCE